MTVACKLCQKEIASDKPDLEAQAQVLERMGRHLGNLHRKEAEKLATLLTGIQQLSATFMLIQNYVNIPPAETSLLKSYEENEHALLQALGLAEAEEEPEAEQKKGPDSVESSPVN